MSLDALRLLLALPLLLLVDALVRWCEWREGKEER